MEEAVHHTEKTAKKKAVAKIRPDQCTGCGICVSVCPAACIDIIYTGLNFNGTARVNRELCISCNFCAIDCPWDAIAMVNPDGSEKLLDMHGKQVKKMRGYA